MNKVNEHTLGAPADDAQPVGDDTQNKPVKKGFFGLPYWKRVLIIWSAFGLMIGLAKIGFYPAVLIAFLMIPWVIGVPLGVNKRGFERANETTNNIIDDEDDRQWSPGYTGIKGTRHPDF